MNTHQSDYEAKKAAELAGKWPPKQQPQSRSDVEALRLAELFEQTNQMYPNADVGSAEVAAELRRLHGRIAAREKESAQLYERIYALEKALRQALEGKA